MLLIIDTDRARELMRETSDGLGIIRGIGVCAKGDVIPPFVLRKWPGMLALVPETEEKPLGLEAEEGLSRAEVAASFLTCFPAPEILDAREPVGEADFETDGDGNPVVTHDSGKGPKEPGGAA